MKRHTWTLLAAFVLSLVLSACGGSKPAPATGGSAPATGSSAPAPAKKAFEGRTLVVASYGGALDQTLIKNVAKKFEEETGGKVILDPSVNFPKLLAEKDAPSVDLTFIDDARVPEGNKHNMFVKLDPSKISRWKDLYPNAPHPSGTAVAWVFGSYGIAYRTDKVKTPPTSWADMWDPALKGYVAVNNLVSNGGVQFFTVAGQLNGGDYKKDVGLAFDKIKQLAPNMKNIIQTTAQTTDLLTSGEYWMVPWWDGRTLNLAKTGVPVAFVRPKEGAFATIVMFSVLQKSKNQDMAYKFIDMALDPEAQKAFASEIFYGPTNKTVKLDGDLANKVVYGEETVKKLIFVDWEYVAGVRPQWIDRWNKEVVPLLSK